MRLSELIIKGKLIIISSKPIKKKVQTFWDVVKEASGVGATIGANRIVIVLIRLTI